MNAISIFKSFTLVMIFIAGVAVKAADKVETKEECKARVTKAQSADIRLGCIVPSESITNGVTSKATPTSTQINSCVRGELASAFEECNDLLSNKEVMGSCDTKFDAYQAKLDKTNEECGKMNGGGLVSCTQKANGCGASLNSSNDGSGEVGSALIGLMGQYAAMQGGKGETAGSCLLEDDTLEDRKSAIDDKIQQLEDDKVDTVTKQSDLDDELAKKKTDVDKEISDLEADFSKQQTERKSKNVQDGEEIQKKIFASDKKQRDNLVQIADKNVQIADLQFAQQQINIQASDVRLNKTCSDKVAIAKAAAMAPVKGTDGKMHPPKFTIKENQKVKVDLQIELDTCMQTEALKKQADLKQILNARNKLQREIDGLLKANTDEQAAVALDKKSMDDLLKIATDAEAKQLEEKNTKLNNLSKSIADLEKIIVRKKAELDQKIKNRQTQIDMLIVKKRNLKPKYSGVSSAISSSKASARAFLAACCKPGNKNISKDHSGCSQVKSDAGDSGFGATGTGAGAGN